MCGEIFFFLFMNVVETFLLNFTVAQACEVLSLSLSSLGDNELCMFTFNYITIFCFLRNALEEGRRELILTAYCYQELKFSQLWMISIMLLSYLPMITIFLFFNSDAIFFSQRDFIFLKSLLEWIKILFFSKLSLHKLDSNESERVHPARLYYGLTWFNEQFAVLKHQIVECKRNICLYWS